MRTARLAVAMHGSIEAQGACVSLTSQRLRKLQDWWLLQSDAVQLVCLLSDAGTPRPAAGAAVPLPQQC